MKKIKFFFTEVNITALKNRKPLKKFISNIFVVEKLQLRELNYIFCNDAYLLDINKEFLHHDYYTDIITFNLSLQKSDISGEIYISIDRVKENALSNKVSFKEELHRVIFHGALHLCGYNDKKKNDKKEMRIAENRCLDQYLRRAIVQRIPVSPGNKKK